MSIALCRELTPHDACAAANDGPIIVAPDDVETQIMHFRQSQEFKVPCMN